MTSLSPSHLSPHFYALPHTNQLHIKCKHTNNTHPTLLLLKQTTHQHNLPHTHSRTHRNHIPLHSTLLYIEPRNGIFNQNHPITTRKHIPHTSPPFWILATQQQTQHLLLRVHIRSHRHTSASNTHSYIQQSSIQHYDTNILIFSQRYQPTNFFEAISIPYEYYTHWLSRLTSFPIMLEMINNKYLNINCNPSNNSLSDKDMTDSEDFHHPLIVYNRQMEREVAIYSL